MKKSILILLFCFPLFLFSQNWNQIGQDIDGQYQGENSGYSVSMNYDGTIVAVGVPYNSDNGQFAGEVRIFENNNGLWLQKGGNITGGGNPAQNLLYHNLGYSVSLNNDGNTVAIGAPGGGYVKIYNWDGISWNQLGSSIIFSGSWDREFGHSVSISSDGFTVAVGAPEGDGNGNNSGFVRVYNFDGNSWIQLGNDIDGEAASNYSGHSVSISSDGSRVSIGAYNNTGNFSTSGHVRVYDWNGSFWVQLGQDIDGEGSGDGCGYSVSLSSDGNTVAIGAPYNSGNAGHVRIYSYNGSSWNQIGNDIDGNALAGAPVPDQLGQAVSLSSDGNTVAIGAMQGSWLLPGYSSVYKNIAGNWVQQSQDIAGEENDDQSYRVSISGDGSILAVGAINNDGNLPNSGHVRLFQLISDSCNFNIIQNDSSICSGDVITLSLDTLVTTTFIYERWDTIGNANEPNNMGCGSPAPCPPGLTADHARYQSSTATLDDWYGYSFHILEVYSAITPTPNNYTYIGTLNGSYYYEYNIETDWTTASNLCNSLGGHLIVISDSLEHFTIDSLINNDYAWIGLYQDFSSYPAGTPDTLVPFVWVNDFSYQNQSYQWLPSGDTTSIITISPSQNTTYYVISTQSGVSCLDSIEISINNVTTGSSSVSACNTYTWEGQIVSSSGNLTHTYQNTSGCDSVHTLSVIINNSISNTINSTICSGSNVIVGTSTYSTTGNYVDSLITMLGCDSIITTNLTVLGLTGSTTTSTSCDTFIWNGNTYNTSGTYTFNTTNSNGCDSIATLNLTINNTVSGSSSVTACDAYTWEGQTITSSGDLIHTYQNSLGCDSVHTLTVSINSPTTSTTTESSCDSYDWNGSTYNTSGTYTYITTNSNGCDSIVTLELTLSLLNVSDVTTNTSCYAATDGSTEITVIGGIQPYSYSWDSGEITQDLIDVQSGNYVLTVTDANLCSKTINISIDEPQDLMADPFVTNASCEVSDDASIDITTYGGTMPYTFLWSNGQTDEDIVDIGIGQYSVIITDINNCETTESVTVNFDGFNDCLFIPSLFTPNGDGNHDDWEIDGLNAYPNIVVKVFNRWGQLLFESSGYTDRWDGTYNGNVLPIATYYYIIDLNNGDEPLNGVINIKR